MGIQANATLVDNQGVTNSGLSTVSGNGGTLQDALITFTDLPLEGFSEKSYNLVLMFEQPKYSARLAWNWRDDYLISQSDCCIKLPIWQDAYGQLDASAHYKPTRHGRSGRGIRPGKAAERDMVVDQMRTFYLQVKTFGADLVAACEDLGGHESKTTGRVRRASRMHRDPAVAMGG